MTAAETAIVDALRAAGATGMTTVEIADRIGGKPLSIKVHICHIRAAGIDIDSDRKRDRLGKRPQPERYYLT